MANGRFEVSGTVEDIKRGGHFIVKVNTIDNGSMYVDCTISGRLRKNKISILRGDSVDIDISSDDPTKGRIVWRHK